MGRFETDMDFAALDVGDDYYEVFHKRELIGRFRHMGNALRYCHRTGADVLLWKEKVGDSYKLIMRFIVDDDGIKASIGDYDEIG